MNRVLIIGMGRSGGYNLGMWLSKELNCPFVHEPVRNRLSESGMRIVTKYLITEWEERPSLYRYTTKIGLIREDSRECAISQLWAEDNGEWRRGYGIPNGWIEENEARIEDKIQWVNEKRNAVLNLKGLDMVVSYEGIYNRGDGIQRISNWLNIGIPKWGHMLDSSNRLRETEGKKKKRLI